MASVEFSDSYRIAIFGYPDNYVRVNYTEAEYDVANNRTKIRLDGVYIKYTGANANCRCYGTLKFNGTTVLTLSGSSYVTIGSSYTYVPDSGNGATVWAQHNSDGTGSFTITLADGTRNDDNDKVFGALYNYGSGTYPVIGVRTPETKTATLTTRPRGSTISSCPSSIATGNALNLTVSRASSSYTHIATFKVGSTTLYTSGSFDTSLSFSVPRSWFSAYPTAASLTVTLSVQTYYGSTAIGSPATKSITVNADADMKPNISSGWALLAPYNTGAVSGFTGYVKSYSQAEATFDTDYIDMTDAVGASIASYSVTCQGETDSTSPYLTPILASTAPQVVCTVTDTRGRTASETFTLSVEDYTNPILTGLNVIRSDSLGVADEDGQYFKATATATFSSVDSQNSCSLTVAAAPSGGSYGAENTMAASAVSGTSYSLTFGGSYSPDTSYTIRITATDTVGNVTYWYATIPTRKWAMKFRVTNNEVAGVAFGKAAETDNLFEITPDWNVKVGGDLTVLGTINGGGGGGGGAMYFPSQTVNTATNAEIFRITNAAITTQTIVTEVTFAGNVSNVSWTSYDGYIAFTGTCAAATTADVTLSNAETPTPQTPLAIANGGTGANTAAQARVNLGLDIQLIGVAIPYSVAAGGVFNTSFKDAIDPYIPSGYRYLAVAEWATNDANIIITNMFYDSSAYSLYLKNIAGYAVSTSLGVGILVIKN